MAVMIIAFILAVVTSFIVPPDKSYITYFDFKTLACLFSVLAVVCALRGIKFFYILARKTIRTFKNLKICILALIYITFIGSMLIANDMALLTFLPLGFYVLKATGNERYMAFTFIMQNIAANLGGMLTPFGNPQNLYLYTKFNIPTLQFMGIMAPPFVISVILLTLCCLLFVKSEPLELKGKDVPLNKKRASVYIVLFLISVIMVFRVIPYYWGLIIIVVFLLVLDREAFKAVDYPLLLTFVFFFVFAGNMARIEPVRAFFSSLLEKNTLVYSIVSCQFISNVPSAILLSQFTENFKDLLLGVNIGGAGTLIASLASLITFREYTAHNPGKALSYIALFSAFNFGFVIILTLFMQYVF